MQAGLARLRVLVIGAGSVGLDVSPRLTATGIEHADVNGPASDEDVIGHLRIRQSA
jgi:hypothetical protein